MLRYILLFPLLAALYGCASTNISPEYRLGSKASTGVVAGTITHAGGSGAFILHVSSNETGSTYRFQHGESQTANIFKVFAGESPHPALGVTGSPFAIELPAGFYTIQSWQISQGAANVRSSERMQIEFEVRAGAVAYIGNYHFTETSKFVRAITGATLSLNDRADRDIPAIRQGFSALASVPLALTLAPDTTLSGLGGPSKGAISIPVFVPVSPGRK